jgi:fructose-1,6-bisphosphatase/inositol monophosphatase family enzyme
MTLRETAIAAARAAGEIQRSYYGRALAVDERTTHDVKLEADRLCEQAVLDVIRSAWPDHAILTEEAGLIGGEGDHYWLIDPLDGTVNFFHGIPYFGTSVACYRRPDPAPDAPFPRPLTSLGEPVVGVVYVPPTDELFVGETGQGATCNGEAIRPSGIADLSEAMVAVGFGAREGSDDYFVEQCRRLAPRVQKLRCLGSAAYDLCNVACGRLSAFYEMRLRPWDIAAGHVVLREAGAVLDAIEREPQTWDVVASAPRIYEPFRDLARG